MILERMTQKRFLAVPAVATLGLVLMLAGGGAAQASHCRKDCQQDIKSCLALVPPNKECTGTKAEKKGCRKTHAAQRKHCRSLTKLCEQQNPSMSGTCVLTRTTPTTTTPRPPTTTSTTTSSTSTTTLVGYSGPVTGLHYAPNHNFDSSGNYVPAQAGFNLADVSSVSELDSLPSGVKGLVYLGLCNGADSSFINAVQLFIGHQKLFGFYLMDQPDPTGRSAPLCPAANLMAESDWIHANVPGAQTFIVMININTSTAPVYANTYDPANSHIDLYAPDPYPCRTEVGGCDYSKITSAVAAVEAAGIPRDSIVPVYQAFGAGNWSDDGGGQYALPTPSQEEQILAVWAPLVPNPVFDYAYSWGTQNADQALEDSPALQAVFSAHNTTSPGSAGPVR